MFGFSIITSIVLLCVCNFVYTDVVRTPNEEYSHVSHHHHNHNHHPNLNNSLEPTELLQRKSYDVSRQQPPDENNSIFTDLYNLWVKFIGMFTQPVGNFFNGLWNMVTFLPKFWMQMFSLSGSVLKTTFELIMKGGYSWLKVQDIIVDFIRDFQVKLLDALRANFFPQVSPYRND